MFGFGDDVAIANRGWKSHGNRVESPILQSWFHLSHHFARSQVRAGFELPFSRTRNHQLHVRTADVDNENSFHGVSELLTGGIESFSTTLIGISLSARAFFFDPLSFFVRSRDTSRNCHCACLLGS